MSNYNITYTEKRKESIGLVTLLIVLISLVYFLSFEWIPISKKIELKMWFVIVLLWTTILSISHAAKYAQSITNNVKNKKANAALYLIINILLLTTHFITLLF